MIKFKIIVFVILAFAKANSIQAQSTIVKLEKEERISMTDFPAKALSDVNQVAGKKRVKYYREFDGERTSYEAKFKIDGRRYSMEYSSEEILEDVEVEVRRRKVEPQVWDAISRELEQISNRWRVEKIQYQFLLPENGMNQLFKNLKENNFQNLELIVAFKDKRKISRREILFDRSGTIINSREIKRIAYDFLLF